MRERIARFMAGRNGNDQLNIFVLVAFAVLIVLGGIIRGTVGDVINLLALLVLVCSYFRMLSRNTYKRSEENGKYMRIRYKLSAKLKLLRERWVQRKDYKFFSCPSCHATLRVPRGHGKINIVCRKCGTSFTGRS